MQPRLLRSSSNAEVRRRTPVIVSGLLRGGTPAGLLVATVTAQWLGGPQLTQQFALTQSWVMIGGLALTLGLGELALREAAPERPEAKRFESWLIASADRTLVVVGLTAAALVVLGSWSAMPSSIGWILLSAVSIAYARVNEGLLRYRAGIALALAPIGAVFPAVTFVSLLGLHSLDGAGYYAFVVGTCGAAVSSRVILRAVGGRSSYDMPFGDGRAWLASGARISISAFAGVLQRNLDILAVAYFAPPHVVAAYAVLFRVGQVASLPLVALTTAYSPVLSRRVQSGDVAGSRRIVERIRLLATPGAAGIYACLAVGFAVVGAVPGFGDSRLSFLIFAVLFIRFTGNALGGPVIPELIFRSYESRTASVNVSAAALHLVGSLLLGQLWGALGVAIAGAVAILVLNVKLNVDARRLPWLNASMPGDVR